MLPNFKISNSKYIREHTNSAAIRTTKVNKMIDFISLDCATMFQFQLVNLNEDDIQNAHNLSELPLLLYSNSKQHKRSMRDDRVVSFLNAICNPMVIYYAVNTSWVVQRKGCERRYRTEPRTIHFRPSKVANKPSVNINIKVVEFSMDHPNQSWSHWTGNFCRLCRLSFH